MRRYHSVRRRVVAKGVRWRRSFQLIFDLFLRLRRHRTAGPVVDVLLDMRMRRPNERASPARIRSVVRYDLYGFSLLLPLSHRLPHYLARYPDYSSNLGRVAAAIAAHHPDLSVIDVGANVGDSVAIIKGHADARVLAIEGEPDYFELLRANLEDLPGVTLEQAYVGATSGSVQARRAAVEGTSRLDLSEQGTQLSIATLVDVLARYRDFQQAKLLKVDTDGWDIDVIEGATDWLQAARPVIFFEYNPKLYRSRRDDEGLGVFELLRGLGYRQAMFFDNLGEYVSSCAMDDEVLVDLHHYFMRAPLRYADIAAFHGEHESMFAALREQERRAGQPPAAER